MNDYPDNELVNMVSEHNEEASDILYEKYGYIVNVTIKKYQVKAKKLGIDIGELRQEAMVGFSDAIACYDQDKDASLQTFITLCVERRVFNYVKRMDTTKEKLYKSLISLDMEIGEDKDSLYDVLKSDDKDPESQLIENESINKIMDKASKELSDVEKQVFDLMLQGCSNERIAYLLNIPIKSVYNKVARIRSKLK